MAEFWLTIREAAPRCSLSRGQMRRIAAKQLVECGEARLQRGHGRPRWVIREDVLARISLTRNEVDLLNHAPPLSIRDYPKRVRDAAMFKARAADAWLVCCAEARRAGVKRAEALQRFMVDFRQRFGTNAPSATTLLDWTRKLRKGGVSALIHGWALRRRMKELELKPMQDQAPAGADPGSIDWIKRELARVVRDNNALEAWLASLSPASADAQLLERIKTELARLGRNRDALEMWRASLGGGQ